MKLDRPVHGALLALVIGACSEPVAPRSCSVPYAIGAVVTETWDDADCRTGSYLYDEYHVSITQPQLIRAVLETEVAAGEQALALRVAATGEYVGFGTHRPGVAGQSFRPDLFTPHASELRFLVEPGDYVVEARSPGRLGSYTLRTTLEAEARCLPTLYVTPGTMLRDTLNGWDCHYGPRGGVYQELWILGSADESITVTHESQSIPFLQVDLWQFGESAWIHPVARDSAAGRVRSAFRFPEDGRYMILIGYTSNLHGPGAYTVRIDRE